MGAAGEKAFKQLKAAVDKANFDKFTASLSKARTDLATVGKNLALLGTGLAAAAGGAGAAVLGLAKSGSEAADAAGKAAQKTGLQIDAYGKLEFAASQADVGNEQFVSGMSKLNKAIAEAAALGTKAATAINQTGVEVIRFGAKAKDAATSAKPVADIFTRLGVNIRDANGKLKTNEQILLDVADAFAKLPDGALKSALAIELFGKAGAELLPFLNAGKKGLIDLGKEAKALGIVFSPEQVAVAEDFNDTLASLGKSIKGTRIQLGLLFAPLFTTLAAGLRDEINKNRDAIVGFGQRVASLTAGVLGDLLHLLSGNSQNIKSPWIREWSAAIIQFGNDVAGVFNGLVLPAFKLLREGAQFVADQINRVFGTDITAGELALGAAVLSAVGAFAALGSTIAAVVAGIGFLAGLVGGIPLAIAAAAVGAGIAIGVFWADIQAGAAAAWQFITEGASAAWEAIVQGASDLWAQIVNAFQGGQQQAVDAFNGIVESIVSAWNGLVDRLGSIAQQIVDTIANWFGTLPQRITAVFNSLVSIASSVLSRVSSLVDSIVSKIQAAISAAKQLVGLGGSSGSGGDSSSGFASGGFASGPGGPKGDKIPAWLSDGEAITQTPAVNYYGRGFFAALNDMRIPRENLMNALRGLRGFSLGGFADSFNRSMAMPSFAGGGFADVKLAPASGFSGKTVNVRLQYGTSPQDVIDLIGQFDPVQRLQQFALSEATASAGRRPGRR
ncbi:hypothetical protein FJW04_21930 [Mesorhizobium sp. B2-7-3]|uniref:hypothetical protein n=1 Tax=unclassified Mesorhizobium TaxID=325217 RepID=UPI001126F1AF|nr:MULTISPECIES: hypothetical protein [unclassified Mesorhizobium]MBZ9927760.1 hypothetical protein [Mesorhizobium sp. BR1-1-4]TPJ12919.1 hypothetical protein FJW04_21930 [Mesorhizobium sp. B2-7-3]